MNKDYTDITLVVDRSGSMATVREEAQGGINGFIASQVQEPGMARLTLVQFDSEYEFVHQGQLIQEVPPYTLVPRGMTALLDAVGRAMVETGQRLARMPEAERPGLVVFVVMTDGQENSSHEFTKARIREMIQEQQQKYSWQFTFLGANQDAFAEARALGMDARGAATFAAPQQAAAWRGTSNKISRMRKATCQGDGVDNAFLSEELEAMREPKK